MNNQQTWNIFKEITEIYAERNLLASTMRNSVSFVFLLIVLNSINIQFTEADLQNITEVPTFTNKDISHLTSSEQEDDDDEDTDKDVIYYDNAVIERLKKIGGGVFNVQIEPHYDPQRNKIVLNVSWDKPLDEPPIHYYHFQITPNSSLPECQRQKFETINRNRTWTSIHLPPLLNPYEVFAGCTYIISVITDRLHMGNFKTEVVYTLPECVGNKCSCRHLSPQVNNISVIEFSPGKLNISWEIDHEGTNETTFNITNILLEYRLMNGESVFPIPFSSLGKPNLSTNLDYFILNDAYNIFTPNKMYELQATFYNTFDCKVINHSNFSINAVEILHDGVEHNAKGFSWEIILVIVIVSLITFLFIIYIVRRNRSILKEILCHPFSLKFSRGEYYGNDRRTDSYIIIPSKTIKRAQKNNPLYVDKEIEEGTADRYEFPRTRIRFIKYLKSGEFGEVYLAKALNINNILGDSEVAVKSIKKGAPAEETENFLTEIDITKKLGEHPNIVRILGCCKLGKPYLIIMEYIPCGDLLYYLLELREKWENRKNKGDRTPVFLETSGGAYIFPNLPRSRIASEGPSLTETEYTNLSSEGFPTPTENCVYKVDSTLDHNELQHFALQIAKGMEHLEKIGIVHRDLAARNILINEFKTLKISDFGMSRISPYVNNKRDKVPLRWLALEAIEDHFYDSKGDVWSFAVVLWEIGTLGASPYPNVENEKVLSYLRSGQRLERPEVCTDELYSLMLRCWSRDKHLRPSFAELVQLLDFKKRHIYVDFSQLNPLYIFPPSKDEKPLLKVQH